MNWWNLLAWISSLACWAVSIVLIVLTESAIQQSQGDVVYVLTAIFVLLGGKFAGQSVSAWIGSKTGGEMAELLQSGD